MARRCRQYALDGFVASSRQFAGCNRCFELDLIERWPLSPGDRAEGAAARGKRMIVQATNIGADVEETQFDLMIPGGGVGLFGTGCHSQVGLGVAAER